MTNILNIQELPSCDSRLSICKTNITPSLYAILGGIVVIVIGTQTHFHEAVSYSMGLIGFLIVIFFTGNILSSPNEIIVTHSKQKLHKSQYYFTENQDNIISSYLQSGKLDSLISKASDVGKFMLIVYSTPDHNYYIAQLFKFVPYQYIPQSSPIIFSK